MNCFVANIVPRFHVRAAAIVKTVVLVLTACLCGRLDAAPDKTIFQCDFSGPYYNAGVNNRDKIQKNCINNYEWGRKDITISTEPLPGGKGCAQRFDINGISSGAMQFFITGFGLNRNKWYRISFQAKGEGLDSIGVCIRKIGGPWTVFVAGNDIALKDNWQDYSFTGQASTDVDRDLGVMFETGNIGRLWIANLKIEELLDAPGNLKANNNPLVKGNIFPRSSYEGKRDYLWSSGIYDGPKGEWEDPQIYRAEPGKFGKYCMAFPTPVTEGSAFCRSFWLPVACGTPYTFSVYLKSAAPHANLSLNIYGRQGNVSLGARNLRISDSWQRYSITIPAVPEHVTDVYVDMSAGAGNGIIYADGFQLEAGKVATGYLPAFPCELYVDMGQQGGNIVTWGEKLPLNLYAAQDAAAGGKIKVRLLITGFPDVKVMEQELELPVNQDYPVTIDPKRNGLFRIQLKAVDEKLAAPQEILAARLPEPRNTGKESSFGTHITVRPFFINYAKKIGMKWIRFHDASGIAKWEREEPKPGEYHYFDQQVDAVVAAGLNILGLPDAPPKWAKTEKSPENVIDVKAFSEHCRRLGEHYRGRIDYWEIWNEPYMNYDFPGTPKQYGKVFEAGAAAFRAGNPNARILGYCTEINGTDYASQIPSDRRLIDILSVHCYFQNMTGGGTSGFSEETQAYLKFLAPFKPQAIWNSEGGNGELGMNSFYSFMPVKPELNDRAAAFGARVWGEQRKGGIDKTFIYTIHQSDSIMYYGGFKKLIGFDRSITPSAASCALTAWCIDGLKLQPCPSFKGVVQSLFAGDSRAVWSVFRDDAVSGKTILNLQKIPAGFVLVDVMGNDPRRDGIVQWEIGIKPLFVISNTLSDEELAKTCIGALER